MGTETGWRQPAGAEGLRGVGLAVKPRSVEILI